MQLGAIITDVNLGERLKSSATYTLQPYRFADAMNTAVPELNGGGSSSKAASHSHVVKSGDNLTAIVKQHLEQAGRSARPGEIYDAVRDVARRNGLRDPDRIHPGQQLNLDSLYTPAPSAALQQDAPAVTPAFVAPPKPVAEFPLTRLQVPVAPAPQPAAKTASALDSDKPFVLVPADTDVSAQGGPYPRATLAGLRSASIGPSLRDQVRAVLYKDDGEVQARQDSSPWASALGAPARMTSGYGYRKDPFTGKREFHNGVDLAAKTGTAVYPVRDGKVVFSGWQSGYGRMVIVEHADQTQTVYAHTSKNLVTHGMQVTAGQAIAQVGSSGRSTGPHLHFEVRRNGRAVDPMPYLNTNTARVLEAKR